MQSLEPTYAMFSPDGRWIAYQLREPGKAAEVYVQPFPATGARYQLPISRDNHHPVWSRDGKELFYTPGPGEFDVISVTTAPGFSFGNPMPVLFKLNLYAPIFPRPYDVTPDGKLIGLISPDESDSGAVPTAQIFVVLNWFQALRQRVPVQ
ncbi:MAG: PD40 domain-containing protein [Acidobacteria bacterium]|nr:PD40 domain-containing protein [Acidobacteriota bacterium]